MNLKFQWLPKVLDTFIKREKIVKQNPNVQGNTNASVLNMLTAMDIISFSIRVLSQNLMLENVKSIQDALIQLLQLAYNEVIFISLI